MSYRIPQHFLDTLIASIDIVDVIGQRVAIKRSGKNYTGCCPFHTEKTPSFTVSAQKQFYHCFGCEANGDAIGFLMQLDGLSFREAVAQLAASVSLNIPDQSTADDSVSRYTPVESMLNQVNDEYVRELGRVPTAHQYLNDSGISAQTIATYELGYIARQGAEPVVKDDHEGMRESGLRVMKKGLLVPWADNKITLPIKDHKGRIRGFLGQSLTSRRPTLSGSTEWFQPESMLYGIHEAASAAKITDTLIVVEKPLEVLALADMGISGCVSTLNQPINTATFEMLFNQVSNVVFCFAAGRVREPAFEKTLLASLSSLKKGRDVSFVVLPGRYRHCASFLSAHGAEAFHQRVDRAIPTIDLLYKKLYANKSIGSEKLTEHVLSQGLIMLSKIPCSLYRRLSILHFQALVDATATAKPH